MFSQTVIEIERIRKIKPEAGVAERWVTAGRKF